TMASWPKRSQNTSPGCIVITPTRSRPASCACAAPGSQAAASASSAANTARSALFAMHAHVQRVQPSRVGAGDAEAEAPERQFLAGFRQVPDRRGDQAADGVVLVVVEVGAEALVEVADRRQRVHHVLAVGLRRDERGDVLGLVVLVVDLAD